VQKESELLKRLLPLLIVALVLVLALFLDLGRYFSFGQLAEHREQLLDWVALHALLAPVIYILTYTLVVAFSLPGAFVMTIGGGFLFGALPGGVYAVSCATVGALLLFLIAKTSVGDYLLSNAGGAMKKMQHGFAENALSYMFVLRLVPIFPFFLVNLVPAFLGISLRVYLFATFFGIMPVTFVYALAGSGLGGLFDQGGAITLAGIMTPEILVALTGLALLALLPVGYKHFNRKTAKNIERS